MKNKALGARASLCLSMAIFGTIALFTRAIPLSSGELALLRAVMAACVVAIFMRLGGMRISFSSIRHELPKLLFSGAAMGINWILLFEAYRYTTISNATLSYYFAPVIVTAVSPFLFRERMTKMQLFCFIMSTIGLALVIGVGDLSVSGTHMTGILFGLGAACFYAAVILLNKRIRSVSGLERTLIQFIAAIIVLTPYVLLTTGVNLGALDMPAMLCLLVLGVVHTGFAYCLYFSSLKDLPGQEAAILSYIDPLVAVLLSVLVLGEAMTPLQAVGGAMILGFTLLNERHS